MGEWTANTKIALKKADLLERKPVGIEVNGKKVMLVIIDGSLYAINSVCSHRGGPLEKGVLTDYIIACPWHGAKYDVRTGKVDPSTPWGKHQESYKATIDGNGEIWIDA